MEELLKELEEIKQKLVENKEKIAEIEKKIEEKKVETGRWKPEKGDEYWYLNGHGSPLRSIWGDNFQDVERYAISNYYQTKEECKFIKEKLKVIAELKEYAEPKNRAWGWGNIHYFLYYDCTMKEVDISCGQIFKRSEIYFESEKKAKQAIDVVGEDRIKKYYLGVEEE